MSNDIKIDPIFEWRINNDGVGRSAKSTPLAKSISISAFYNGILREMAWMGEVARLP